MPHLGSSDLMTYFWNFSTPRFNIYAKDLSQNTDVKRFVYLKENLSENL